MLNLICSWRWSNIEGFSNIRVSLGYLYYFHTTVCLQMTSSEHLSNVENSKLTCETNWWTDSCVMQFYEQAMILHLCGSGKFTTFLCFSIRGGDARVPAQSRTWGVDVFMERSMMCRVITGLGCVFHFGSSEVKWHQKDTKAL